ncbi:Multidrug resistance protein fnx1 [Pleurostoma richardsiae]|uniref:Multidrug resistance protein fnx1 n=1 Tax=Pleurostoma richardsiae TaxID=41990 RepID=A0AA38RPS7_9PEZI|nr:Multidrug resistance protein fnx1 [Pleurostoma richardsiae]
MADPINAQDAIVDPRQAPALAAAEQHSQNGLSDETTPLLVNSLNNGHGKPLDDDRESQREGSVGSGDDEDGAGNGPEQTVLVTDMPFAKLALILGTSYLGVFLGAVDSTIIATLSAPISSEFHSLSLLSWLATAYLIANAACQPISGRLTDIFGRGPGLVFSNVFFAAGNLICGLAQSDGVMILGRVVAGIGGGGLMSISTFLASDLIPLRNRGVTQGIGNICYGTGAMLGGVFGGLINDTSRWGWRLAFLVQVPVVVISGILVFFLVKVPPKASDRSYLSRIDFTGALLTVSFLVVLLLGLNAGGNFVSWTDPLVLTTLPVSVLLFVGFVAWEARSALPIIPVRLLVDRTVLAACLTNLLCTMALNMLVFYVPLYLQVRGYSATESGLRLVASSLGVSFTSFGSGYVMRRTGRYVALGAATVLAFAAGAGLMATLGADSPDWVGYAGFVLAGGGYGGMLTVTLLACIAAVDHTHHAPITSATYAFRSVGATVGVTVASAVYQNVLRARLWERFGGLPGAAEEIGRIRDDLAELGRLPEGWREGVMASFMEAFKAVWLTALGLAVAGLVCISLMKHHTLHSNLARK